MKELEDVSSGIAGWTRILEDKVEVLKGHLPHWGMNSFVYGRVV